MGSEDLLAPAPFPPSAHLPQPRLSPLPSSGPEPHSHPAGALDGGTELWPVAINSAHAAFFMAGLKLAGGLSQSPELQLCRSWPLLKVLPTCRARQHLARHTVGPLFDSFGFQQQRPEIFQLEKGFSEAQPSQAPTQGTGLRCALDKGRSWGPPLP